MKLVPILVLLAVMALALGCKGTLKDRRLGLRHEKFKTYSRESKASIIGGEVIAGMSREQVYLARGVPEIIERGGESPEVSERWVYNCSPHERLIVEFERGKVVKVDREFLRRPERRFSLKP